MIGETFYVKNFERLNLTKEFIRKNMPSARLVNNPIRLHSGLYKIKITYEIEDKNKLSQLRKDFYLEDNPPAPPKKHFLTKLLNFFTSGKTSKLN